jgi:hypothetical protein
MHSQGGCDPALDRDTDVINPEGSNQHTEEQLCQSDTIANDQSVGRIKGPKWPLETTEKDGSK